jgi:hypothetical protein
MLWQGREKATTLKMLADRAGGVLLRRRHYTIILVVIYLLLGGDPQALFNCKGPIIATGQMTARAAG